MLIEIGKIALNSNKILCFLVSFIALFLYELGLYLEALLFLYKLNRYIHNCETSYKRFIYLRKEKY